MCRLGSRHEFEPCCRQKAWLMGGSIIHQVLNSVPAGPRGFLSHQKYVEEGVGGGTSGFNNLKSMNKLVWNEHQGSCSFL